MNVSAKPDPEPLRLQQMAPVLESRHRLLQAIRVFFDQRGYLEVTTPVRVQAPALEEHIDCPPGGDRHRLRASPELHMKRLLAALNRPIFQIGPCFRAGERGPVHLPEFTMLEWYRQDADRMDILAETKDLIRYCAEKIGGGGSCRFRRQDINFAGPWRLQTVDSVFTEVADRSLDQAVAEDTFEQVLVEQVLPAIGGEQPLVLLDFPLSLGGLARKNISTGRAERWELFAGGVELANAYTELTDWHEQLERFQAAARRRRAQKLAVYPLDRHYLELLRQGFPPCSGIALGFDRLLMVLLGKDRIDQVVPFVPELEAVVELEAYADQA